MNSGHNSQEVVKSQEIINLHENQFQTEGNQLVSEGVNDNSIKSQTAQKQEVTEKVGCCAATAGCFSAFADYVKNKCKKWTASMHKQSALDDLETRKIEEETKRIANTPSDFHTISVKKVSSKDK